MALPKELQKKIATRQGCIKNFQGEINSYLKRIKNLEEAIVTHRQDIEILESRRLPCCGNCIEGKQRLFVVATNEWVKGPDECLSCKGGGSLPINYCRSCKATGARNHFEQRNGQWISEPKPCNVCAGTGVRKKR